MRWREPIDDLDELANAADIHLREIHALVLKADEKGFLTYNEDGIALTPKGWKWYEKHGQE